MISLPAIVAAITEHARLWIRHFAFAEMKLIASGWGLEGNFPSPEEHRAKPLQLNFSDRSRRLLARKGLPTRYLASGH